MGQSVKNQVRKSALVWHGPEKQEPHNPRQGIRLADFIEENTKHIVSEWETFARTLIPSSNNKTPLALRDHINPMLTFIVSDMKAAQTRLEQVQKSQGKKEKNSAASGAEGHAAIRLASGFDIDQMVSEFRALRASVIKLWTVPNTEMNKEDVMDLTRFNESIDQIVTESVSHYTKKVNYSKGRRFCSGWLAASMSFSRNQFQTTAG